MQKTTKKEIRFKFTKQEIMEILADYIESEYHAEKKFTISKEEMNFPEIVLGGDDDLVSITIIKTINEE